MEEMFMYIGVMVGIILLGKILSSLKEGKYNTAFKAVRTIKNDVLDKTNENLRSYTKDSIIEKVIRTELEQIMCTLSLSYNLPSMTNEDLLNSLLLLNADHNFYLDKSDLTSFESWQQLLLAMLVQKIKVKLFEISSKFNLSSEDLEYIYMTMIDRIKYMKYFET